MEHIRVSILTPTYNHEKFIGKCIESVLAQSYPHWEQIIVDDGSNDKTEEIVRRYKDKRIKYIKQENKGIWKLNETYNKALDNSTGDVIAILEGDDFWPENKLEIQISTFNDPAVVLSWGTAEIANDADDIIGFRPKSIGWLSKRSNKKLFKTLFFGNFIPACTVMCRKSTLVKINGFKQCKQFPYVDHTTWLELGLNGNLLYLDHILGYWRHHETQISEIMSLEMIESLVYGIDLLKRMSKLERKQINIGLKDLVAFNIIHFAYNIIYSIKYDGSYNSNELQKVKRKSSSSLTLKLRMVLIELYTISKINIKWFIFIIRDK